MKPSLSENNRDLNAAPSDESLPTDSCKIVEKQTSRRHQRMIAFPTSDIKLLLNAFPQEVCMGDH